jgi:hypothetical protein
MSQATRRSVRRRRRAGRARILPGGGGGAEARVGVDDQRRLLLGRDEDGRLGFLPPGDVDGEAAPTAPTATTAISPRAASVFRRAASPATAVPAPWCLHPDDAVVGAVVTVTIVEVLVGADGGEGR